MRSGLAKENSQRIMGFVSSEESVVTHSAFLCRSIQYPQATKSQSEGPPHPSELSFGGRLLILKTYDAESNPMNAQNAYLPTASIGFAVRT